MIMHMSIFCQQILRDVKLFCSYCSSSEANGRNDSAIYNLGLVCNTFVDSKEEENKVSENLHKLHR